MGSFILSCGDPELRKPGGGDHQLSSLAGKNAFTGGAAYCAAKAGLNQSAKREQKCVTTGSGSVHHDGIRSDRLRRPNRREKAPWKIQSEDVADS